MVVLKERCPNCGGTIFISDPSGAGECDSCGSVFSLSDLQKIKETIAFNQARIRENDYGAEGSERCEAALDTSDTEEMPFEELCLKTEMALEAEQWRVAKNFVEEIVRRNPNVLAYHLEQYINAHLDGDLSTEALCKRFFVSRAKLYQMAKQAFGMGVSDYIRKQRHQKAKKLLTHTAEPISQIAALVGIPDTNYFIRTFKNAEGVTPLQYRKNRKV